MQEILGVGLSVIAALTGIGSLGWGIYVHKQKAQARLLSVIGASGASEKRYGDVLSEGQGVLTNGVRWTPRPKAYGDGMDIVLAEERALSVSVHLVSTSDEVFSDINVTLLKPDGTEVEFAPGGGTIAPRQEWRQTVIYPDGVIAGSSRVQVKFRDANGRWWVRVSGQRVRRLRKKKDQPEVKQHSGKWVKVGNLKDGYPPPFDSFVSETPPDPR